MSNLQYTIFRPGGLDNTKDDIKKKCPTVSRARHNDMASSSILMRLTNFSDFNLVSFIFSLSIQVFFLAMPTAKFNMDIKELIVYLKKNL